MTILDAFTVPIPPLYISNFLIIYKIFFLKYKIPAEIEAVLFLTIQFSIINSKG